MFLGFAVAGHVGGLSVTGPVTVTSGTCLKLKGKTEEPICDYPKAYPLVKSWPEGSFSGQLMEKHKIFYNLTLNFIDDLDGKSSEGSGTLCYDEFTGNWSISSAFNYEWIWGNWGYDGWVNRLGTSVSDDGTLLYIAESVDVIYGGEAPTPMNVEISASCELEKLKEHETTREVSGIHDGMFSYKDGPNGSVVRSAPYMLVSPNNLDLHELMHSDNTEQYLHHLNSGNLMSLRYNYLALYTNAGNWLAEISYYNIVLGLTGIEGNTDVGYFVPELTGDEYDALNAAITEIDSANRSNPNENQWLTLEEYNTKHGTNFSW